MRAFFQVRKRTITQRLLLLGGAVFSYPAYAHSVAQAQTTKFLAPETLTTLLARAGTASPGLQVGDVVSYIIQFTPVANGATTGVAGYITDCDRGQRQRG